MFNRAALLLLAGASLFGAEALRWEAGDFFRRAEVQVEGTGKVGFTLVPGSNSGVAFTNTLSLARTMANQNLLNGSGVALGDFDGDGLCDLYFANLNGTNALYKNLGNWKFKDVTTEAGVTCYGQACTGATFADINGDSRLDLLVTALGGPNACFINNGNGKFTDVSAKSGITSRLGAMSMALGDIDGNGTLDLYVANYGATSIIRSGGSLNVSYVNGRPVVRGRYAQRIKIIDNMMFELGEPDALYLNDGKGNFRPLAWTGGRFLDEEGKPFSEKEIPWDQGLSVIFRDINGDLAPDIYVCNDAFTPDRFWINDGKGNFRAIDPLAWRTTSHFSMGVDFGDLNRDGHDDYFVVDMLSRKHEYFLTQKANMPRQPRSPGDLTTHIQVRRNTLGLNRGDGTFAELAFYAGVAGSEWSWSGMFLDVDLDGWEDVLVSNGFPFNVDDVDTKEKVKKLGQLTTEQSRRTLTMFPPLDTPNVAFRNEQDMTFTEVGREWGFDSRQVSNGMALGDLDNDGDLDVVVNCLNAGALLYRNEAGAPRLTVRLNGKAPNTQGIGAKIRVTGGPVMQGQEVMSGGRYVSGDDPIRMFACGSGTNKLRVEVTWRNGSVSVVENARPNSIYEIDERGAKLSPKASEAALITLFADASESLKHQHAETVFTDPQPSLPHTLGQMGPGISWVDFDKDGFDDLWIGNGKGSELALFRNNGQGAFEPAKKGSFGKEETSAALGWANGLLVGVNNYEGGSGNNVVEYRFNPVSTNAIAGKDCVGPLALTVLDGKVWLFVGGGFTAGNYPKPAPSYIYNYNNNQWVKDEVLSKSLSGLVSGAVWSDLDQDGAAELLLACEWGPLRIYKYNAGTFSDQTETWGLSRYIGGWQSITTADLDNDGRMDLVAGNWGLNSFYHQSSDHQVEIIYGDINGTGGTEMLEAYYNTEMKKTVPWRPLAWLSQSFPWLAEKYPTHKSFASASVEEIFGERLARASRVKTTTLTSMVFLNRGGKFEARELPQLAQYAPVFGISAADFDGDGFEDLFLAQNFFAVREEDSPLDAGRGLLLRGKGAGEFEAMDGRKSGLRIYGEQRGCAVADYNQDGRVDLVVTQNGSETKLFQNQAAAPGLRIRLKPTPNNPGVGVQLRLGDGPMREVHFGSGYWSQDSATQVLSRKSGEQKLQVTWPGGKKFEKTIPAAAKEIEIDGEGNMTVKS